MKKQLLITTSLIGFCFLAGCGGESKKSVPPTSTISPAAVSVTTEGTPSKDVSTLDGTTTDMLSADYWIANTTDASSKIKNTSQISDYNKALLGDMDEKNGEIYDLEAYPKNLTQKKLATLIENATTPNETFYLDGKKISSNYWNFLLIKRNITALKEKNPVRYGVTVRRSSLRLFPSADVLNVSKNYKASDALQETALLAYEPLLILHESNDANWYYVVTYHFRGWVSCNDIAVFQNRADWKSFKNSKNYLTVTGDKLTLDEEPESPKTSGMTYTMGTRLPLAKSSAYSSSKTKRTTYGNYVAKLPVRKQSGKIAYEYVLIPSSQDVTKGALTYTRANVLKQVFKTLGDRYGYCGVLGGRDSASLVMEVYRTFGFDLPRRESVQSAMSCQTIQLSGFSDNDMQAQLNEMAAGDLLYTSNQAFLYLGCKDKKYYAIGALATANKAGHSVDVHSIGVICLNETTNSKTMLSQLLYGKQL